MVRGRMRGFIDLHCHWVAGVDDGAETTADSLAMLTELHRIGFDTVVATPHMRPGMFDNDAGRLTAAFEATRAALAGAPGLPALALSSEHFFDDQVFRRLVGGTGLPYPGARAALVEFPPRAFPLRVADRFFDMRMKGLRPVLAHPERYEPVWKDIGLLEPLLDGGAVLLLDVAALAGKYGRAPRKAAERLVEEGFYQAACSDAHSVKDIAEVAKGIRALIDLAGDEEATFLLAEGPKEILEGTVQA
jgi:protein-tyrosine phosphatase